MYTNNLEVIVHAPVKSVWKALTNSQRINEWMKNVYVKTDWKEGSPILYTCHDANGKALELNGRLVIWDGILETVVKNKELSCLYPSKASGVEKETYHLVEVFPEITKISFAQECLSPEPAESYKEDTKQTLEKLKEFLES